MKKYCKILNEETGMVQLGVGCSDSYYIEIGMKKRDVKQSDIDFEWYLEEKCPMKTKEQKQKEEKERISNLTCTKRVFILLLEELGLDYFEQIEPLINANRRAKLEWELCSSLQRKNPLLEEIGKELKITSEQLDKLFKYANGEIETLV